MLKKLTVAILLSFTLMSVLSAQSYEVKPYGISAAGVAADTNDIFDTKYNGSTNVGVGKVVYLAGIADDTTFSNPTWTIASKPSGSTVSFLGEADLDENTKIVKLIPDLEGTYQFELSDGGNVLDAITINAGLYKGLPESGFSCATCHGDAATSWSGTAHANAVQPYVDDDSPENHFQEFCLGCHATGYDLTAVNDGFDDFNFEFPATLQPGNYDALVAAYPDAMQRANVQCEACHGPGSAHMGAGGTLEDSKMIISLASENCAYCHDSFPHHVLPSQYDVSRHGNPTTLARGSSSSCARCHSGSGFVAFVDNGMQNPDVIPTPEKISCAVCHDPHSAENDSQLRLVTATLANGYEVTSGNSEDSV